MCTPPYNRYKSQYIAGKLRLFIQKRSTLDKEHETDRASSIISIDYNPTIIDEYEMKFPGIPMKFNFSGINEKENIQRIAIGNPKAFLMILEKCKDILNNLISKTSSIWTQEDENELEMEREINPTMIPFPGYKDGEDNIASNEEKLLDIYTKLVKLIQTKIDDYHKIIKPESSEGGKKK